MTAEQFAYWLNGFFEISLAGKENENLELNPVQIDMIQKHLQSVFTQVVMIPNGTLVSPSDKLGGSGDLFINSPPNGIQWPPPGLQWPQPGSTGTRPLTPPYTVECSQGPGFAGNKTLC